ncbi:MAG: glycosyltransferase family 2 protein [Henriciella sp.]|jgi:dolichol-phosphate mannosyltransferase
MLSVLIPFYNEHGNVLPLLEEIHTVLEPFQFEIICVNDASSDQTSEDLAEACHRWPETVHVLTHVQRRGKSAALFTGLKAVRGSWVQLLDGDGQNDVRDTARLWPAVMADQGKSTLGIIAGRRNSRNDSGFKWLQSRIANGIRKFVLRDDATDTGCGWKLIRTEAFRELPYFASMHRFLPALVKRAGWRVQEEGVNDRPRWNGQSKYGFLGRLGAGIFDLIGMFWLTRRGGQGIAIEWDDPRSAGSDNKS